MDSAAVSAQAATWSAYAAGAAAIAATAVAGIQLYIGVRQTKAALVSARAALTAAESAGRHRIAAFRQEWINSVIETLTELYSIMVMGVATEDTAVPLEARRVLILRTKLEILLNPNERDTIALLAAIDKIQEPQTISGRMAFAPEMLKIARRLLKAEWVRLKSELQ